MVILYFEVLNDSGFDFAVWEQEVVKDDSGAVNRAEFLQRERACLLEKRSVPGQRLSKFLQIYLLEFSIEGEFDDFHALLFYPIGQLAQLNHLKRFLEGAEVMLSGEG